MLTGAGFGDHAFLAHRPRQQRLADGVVDFVRAGVIQVFALEKNLRASDFGRQALGVVQRAGTADIIGQVGVKFGLKGGVGLVARVVIAQLVQRLHQGFRNKTPAVDAEMAALVWHGGIIDRGGIRVVSRHRLVVPR